MQPLDQLVGGADHAGGAQHLRRQEAFLLLQNPAVVAAVDALVAALGRVGLQQLGVVLPNAGQGVLRWTAEVAELIIGIMHGGHGHGPALALHPLRIRRLAILQHHHGGQRRGVKPLPLQDTPMRLRTGRDHAPDVGHHRTIPGRGQHGAVAMLAGQRQGARAEAGDVEGNFVREVDEALVRHDVANGDGGLAVQGFLAAQQRLQFAEVGVVVGDALRRAAQHPHGRIAGADAAEGAARRQRIDGGDGGGGHRCRPGAGHRHPGAQANARSAHRRQGQRGVAVRPQHLAVRQPSVAVA